MKSTLKARLSAVLLAAGLGLAMGGRAAPSAPNILWITAEDLSPHLGCYGDRTARTPNLDALARRSVRYDRAYATAPVCSPARSCLITGVYATSLGTQRLRSQFPIPPEFKGFPAYLRAAGYFTSNNSKTDYNLQNEGAFIREAWNVCGPQAHWRQRQPGQPFFSVVNLMITHQSRASVWSFAEFEKMIGEHLTPAERQAPATVPVPPYYPDTPLVRRTLARFYDCIAAMDKVDVARILQELEADGLAEDTIVFFYGDHGDGLPRHKRLLHDSGLRVPLLIHFPKKYQHLAPVPPGGATDRLVSFVDFAPTVLSLAGVKGPPHFQGTAFLGAAAGPPRDYVHGARDRVDEAFDLSRSVRDDRYLYIRNYMPHLSWCPPEGYSDQSDMRRELRRLARTGGLQAAQLTYVAPRKAPEELYDTQTDPFQLHNLAASAGHQAVRERLRAEHHRWLRQTRDLGFLPEQEVWDRCGDQPPLIHLQTTAGYDLERVLAAAGLVGQAAAVPQQTRLLADRDRGVRYWAAVGLQAAGPAAAPARDALMGALKDPAVSVRIEAAAALAAQGEMAAALPTLRNELQGDQLASVLHAARVLELAGPPARPALPAMQAVLAQLPARQKQEGDWLFVQFSLAAAVRELLGPVE